MKRNQLKPIVLAVITVLVLGTGIFALTKNESDQAPKADQTKTAKASPALTVTTARPQQTELPMRIAANGNIAAWQEAIIGSQANGLRLTDVRVNVGDRVRAGEVLATFSAETVQADVAQARAALLEAEATAADAAANADRARTLKETGALSTQQINQYLTTEQTAKARVEAAKATLAAQQLRLKQTKLLAPDSGIVSSRSATVGAVVPAGTELFRMIRQGRLEWRAEVTASELTRLKTGMPVTVIAANGTEVEGRIRTFAPTIDPQNRVALVYVDLPKPAEKADPNSPVKAGMFAKGEFNLGKSPALTVPQQAVVVRDGFSYVFVLDADNRVTQVKVQAGRRVGDRVEIREGIAPDATVVVSGAGFLNDRDLVKVVQPAAAASTGTDAAQSNPK